jgi:hypothetical protein
VGNLISAAVIATSAMPKESKMKWISVEQDLPEEEDLVLVWLNCDFISIGYVSDGEWLFSG